MKTCTIDGCDKPQKARGWCPMHYNRWHRHGNPLDGGPLNITCGTYQGYRRHRRNNEPTCQPCRDAMAAYNRWQRATREMRKNERPKLTPCKECGVPRKPKGSNPKDYPGHKLYANKDLCKTCYMRMQRRKAGKKRVMARPDNCIHCGRELYTSNRDKPHEGAVQHGGKGACISCYRAGRKATPATKAPTNCVACEHPLRKGHSSEDDYPGTREHSGKGLCKKCYNARRYADNPVPVEAGPVVDAALSAMMRARRERLAREARRKRAAQILANQGRRPAA